MAGTGCVALIAAAALAQGGRGSSMRDTDQLTGKATVAAAAQTAFGLRLLRVLAATEPHRNIFVSPTSVFLALGMLESGAAGGTRAEIRATLAVPADVREAALHESAAALSNWLRRQDGAELAIANALWADRHISLPPEYVEHCRRFYESQAQTLDFHDPAAAAAINAWVRANTRNKIAEIVSERAIAASKAILTNAVYFKGKWQIPFEKKLTRPGPFHGAGSSTTQANFMHQTGLRHAYRSAEGYQAAVLDYAPDGGLALAVVLPRPGSEVAEVLAKIDVRKLLRDEQAVELDLRLPRFTMDYGTSLRLALSQMGMAAAFDYGSADFSPLGSREFFVGDVLHKTRLELDEEGTVAAAATAILAPMGMPQPLEKKTLTVDRPFGLLLCERQTGAVVFAGVVYEP